MATPAFQEMPPPMRAATAPLMLASMMFGQQHEAAVRRAGVVDQGGGLAAALFQRIISSRSGAIVSVHEHEDTFSFIRHADGKIHLAVESMFQAIGALREEAATGGPGRDRVFPLILSAGERRSSNATTNYRDPKWRAIDAAGALRIHQSDATALGVTDGDLVRCESRSGAILVTAQVDDTVQPGAVSLPHGFGLQATSDNGERVAHGPLLNMLSADH
jgi:anaerobic selenocysteine-containing dehydrogenase